MPAALISADLILVLDAALDGCLAAVVQGDQVVAELRQDGGRGSSAVLPDMARHVLDRAGAAAADLLMVAVTVGPGSFTGVRAALALAHGIGLATGVAVVGVGVGSAIRAEAALRGATVGRPVWVAIDSKRGRVFLDTGDGVRSVAAADMPLPDTGIDVAGDAAAMIVGTLFAAGCDARILPVQAPGALGIARAAAVAGLPAVPLYVDAVAARPGAAMRPAPV